MDDFDDEQPVQIKQKHAAKTSENDKDALLSSGDERAEYTDIFEVKTNTNEFGSSIVGSVDFEDGESVSASDDEVTGYTGDLENYTESEIDQRSTSVIEGTLIDINDDNDKEESVLEKSQESTKSLSKSVTNESISEIAEKLSEVDVTNTSKTTIDVKPGNPIKVRDDDENDDELAAGYSSSKLAAGYSSETTQSKDQAEENHLTEQRRKKYRKRTTSRGSEQQSFTSSGEYKNNDDCVNGSMYETKHKPKRKSHKPKPPTDEKLVEIETPPQTPRHQDNGVGGNEKNEEEEEKPKAKKPIRTIPVPGYKPPVKTTPTSEGNQKKRKRTRHKVYLDDPDVHQLISDHSMLLQRYLEDVKMGRTPKRQPQPVAMQKQHNVRSPHSTTPQHYHQQHTHHQQTFYATGGSGGGPYSSHHSNHTRGKNVIARIRNEAFSSSSSDDEEDYGKPAKHGGYQRVNAGNTQHHRHRQTSSEMPVCPDCGEYHADVEVKEEDEICPDCGVRHNPYQHGPGAYQHLQQSKPWKRYKDACRDMVRSNSQQNYQEVSTEQDPEDVRQDTLPSIDGPHTEQDLNSGVRYKMKYLGSCQITTQHPVTKETRMQQAQDAYKRIKNQDDDEDEDDVSTNVDMFISLERIKIINKDTKFEDVMMDHALRTVCFICDMGNILVLMARRLTSNHTTDFSIEQGKPITLGSIVGDREKKTSKNICHVFESEVEASKVAKAIGQAFNMAYRQFLTSNGIAHEHVEEAEYGHVLESQKLVGQDLDRLTDTTSARDVVVNKRRGDPLGVMLLESGWGSMLPTVFIAHLANYSAAARSQRLSVGDHILTCNSVSLVGLPLSECNAILRNTKSSERVIFRVVSCPPVVDVVVSRPDVKYQLGFSVQNGTICSLLRGGIAERGGVRVGHRIIEINGDSVVAKSHQYIVDILANTVGSISMKTMPVAMYRLMVGDDQPEHV